MQIRPKTITGFALALYAGLSAFLLCPGIAAAQDIRIAHVYDKTGALEAYAKQTQTGFCLLYTSPSPRD